MAIKFGTSSLTEPTYKAYSIEKFNGVDYTTTPTEVADTRALDISNYVPQGNALVKRNGYSLISQNDDYKVYSIVKFKTDFLIFKYKNEGDKYLINVFKAYAINELNGKLFSNDIETDNLYFWSQEYNGVLFMLFADNYYMYDGENVSEVKNKAYIPTVAIGIGHTMSNDKMVSLEQYNLLASSCYISLNQYIPDAETDIYTYDLGFIGKSIINFEVVAGNVSSSSNYNFDLATKMLKINVKREDYYSITIPFSINYKKWYQENISLTYKNYDKYGKDYHENFIIDENGEYAITTDVINALKSKKEYANNDIVDNMTDTYTYLSQELLDTGISGFQKYKIEPIEFTNPIPVHESATVYYEVTYTVPYGQAQLVTNVVSSIERNDTDGTYVKSSDVYNLISYIYKSIPDFTYTSKKSGYMLISDVKNNFKYATLNISSLAKYKISAAAKVINYSDGSVKRLVPYSNGVELYQTIVTTFYSSLNYTQQIKKKSLDEKYINKTLPPVVCKITYSDEDYKTIVKNRFGISYGSYGYRDRLFLAGNEEHSNTDYHSCQCSYPLTINEYDTSKRNLWDDYTYFGDMAFQTFGSSNTEITGYGMLNNGTMAVFKKSEPNQSNLYFRTYNMQQDSEGNYIENFPISLSGLTIGSDYPNQIIQYDNKLLINTPNGINAVDLTTSTASQAYDVKELSYMIREDLSSEINNSCFAIYDGKLFISRTNKSGLKRLYVADKDRYTFVNDKKQYEWWVLDGINADKMFVIDNSLYFIDNNKGVFKFVENQLFDEFLYEFDVVTINGRTINTQATLSLSDNLFVFSKDAQLFKDSISTDYEKEYNFVKDNIKFNLNNIAIRVKYITSTFNVNYGSNENKYIVLIENDKDAEMIIQLYNEGKMLSVYRNIDTTEPYFIERVTNLSYEYMSGKLALTIIGTKGTFNGNPTNGKNEIIIKVSSDEYLYSINEMYAEVDTIKYPLSSCHISNNTWYYQNNNDYRALGLVSDISFNYVSLRFERTPISIKILNNNINFKLSARYHKPIIAYWYSGFNALGNPLLLKTTYSMTFIPDVKRGGTTRVGYQTSKTNVFYNAEFNKSSFQFNNLQFDDIVFGYDNFAHTYSSKKKIKNFAFLQFVLFSDTLADSTITSLSIRYRLVKNNKGVK